MIAILPLGGTGTESGLQQRTSSISNDFKLISRPCKESASFISVQPSCSRAADVADGVRGGLFDDPDRQAFAFTEQLVRDPAPEETFFP